MASIVLKSLSILLGLFFILVGILKITPQISRELHKDLRRDYVRYARVFPLSKALEFKVSPKWYRRTVGGLEILFGIILAFIPNTRLRQVANFMLAIMMANAVYAHWMVADKFERLAPALVFFFMLTCRLIVDYQVRRQEAKDKLAAATPPVVEPLKNGKVD